MSQGSGARESGSLPLHSNARSIHGSVAAEHAHQVDP